MKTFNIQAPDEALRPLIQEKIDNLNKPKGSLGRLETLAMQICLAQQTLTPSLAHPCHLLLGGDHGIEREGVSVSPREVTWQQMINFTKGGGGVNMFCRQHSFHLRIVDVGVDHDLSQVPGIINRKIAFGTRNFLHEPAMTEEEYIRTLTVGIDLVDVCHTEGSRILCLGEMGIANTSPSSIWMSLFCHMPLSECIGAGAGLNAQGISHKQAILTQALDRFLSVDSGQLTVDSSMRTVDRQNAPQLSTVNRQLSTDYIIRYFGGFEMVAAIGAMLRAAELKMLILVDGFIMTACALAACQLYPEAQAYMIFGHCGDESGHRRMLDALHAEPLLSLGLRLGEGTGALCAFPIVDSAVRMMNEMNNFDNAQITKYF
ncbi:MAG: nicotinate-nucleotide--dimethylbenzimidazole phosphoribosyltransferase [Bacteroidaceae bacterium]|nr:nicotinate-nucleotide--dimethylbenzimidazole phosphoribosyltransferase [Bacteroidaceae bacterium]MBS7322196.1 nicotinate-nucleotide--dimethylbenzimidazole phosphoribosyltransferase [Bacteroidaceae bacterium]MCI6802719.1 nicotinate-nucleotide--dimethylbenzimidazole phosphoribosyltransferase [Prevotellaceae bacterium]